MDLENVCSKNGRKDSDGIFCRRPLAGMVSRGPALRPGPAQGGRGVRDSIEEPWVNQIHVALLRAKKEMGIQYDWSESVKIGRTSARVMREYAEKGYQLVTGDAFGAERIARRVAADLSQDRLRLRFGHRPGGAQLRGLRQLDPRTGLPFRHDRRQDDQEQHHRGGAAMPIPEVNRLANAFHAGAKETNPNVKCKFSFIGSFFDPPRPRKPPWPRSKAAWM